MLFTLQEFIKFTKAGEYIIAIVAVLMFMAFWRLMTTGSKNSDEAEAEETKAFWRLVTSDAKKERVR